MSYYNPQHGLLLQTQREQKIQSVYNYIDIDFKQAKLTDRQLSVKGTGHRRE